MPRALHKWCASPDNCVSAWPGYAELLFTVVSSGGLSLTIMQCVRRQWPALAVVAAAIGAGCSGGTEDPAAGTKRAAASDFTIPAAGAPFTPKPLTTDPNVALTNMVQSYKEPQTFYAQSEATIVITSGGKQKQSRQQIIVRSRRAPDSVTLHVRDTESGTQEVYADGKYLVTYAGTSNEYKRRNASGDMLALCRQIDKYAYQVMSPLTFLQSSGVPEGMSDLKYEGLKTVDRKEVHIVSGRLSPSYIKAAAKSIFNAANLEPAPSAFRVWLDKSTYVVHKIGLTLAWKGTQAAGEEAMALKNPAISILEVVRAVVPNSKMADDSFKFTVPVGARERFVESSE